MASRDRHGELRAEVPEGDYADQAIPAHPDDHEEHEGLPPGGAAPADASDADWIEQQRAVPLDDDLQGANAED